MLLEDFGCGDFRVGAANAAVGLHHIQQTRLELHGRALNANRCFSNHCAYRRKLIPHFAITPNSLRSGLGGFRTAVATGGEVAVEVM